MGEQIHAEQYEYPWWLLLAAFGLADQLAN
jgi:hypothetical protein